MSDETENKKKARPATVVIKNDLAAGRLFTSLGIVAAGQCVELPKDEAKRFVATGKASVVIPE
jgi:hypothetical protein